MRIAVGIAAAALLALVLVDAFVTVILARRTDRRLRFTRRFYRLSWGPFRALAVRIRDGTRREDLLSAFGPLSFLMLVALWALGVMFCSAGLQWSAGMQLRGRPGSFADSLYYSGTTLFTVEIPEGQNAVSRILYVAEAGLGFSFLGLAITYLPM